MADAGHDNAELAAVGATRASGIVRWTRLSYGLARERCASPNGANHRSDRSTAEGRVVLIFQERCVRRAACRRMNAVRREGRQLVLRTEPSRLLPKTGRQNKERLPTKTSESLVLAKDGS